MGKGILNRGNQVHQSKTKKFKWEDELNDDEEEMLKKVLKMREQLTEERWMLKTRGQNRNMSIEQ